MISYAATLPMTKQPFRINHPNIPMWTLLFNSLYEAQRKQQHEETVGNKIRGTRDKNVTPTTTHTESVTNK
jgi:hypothetical protein